MGGHFPVYYQVTDTTFSILLSSKFEAIFFKGAFFILQSIAKLIFQYHTMLSSLLPVVVSHRRHHALHPPYDAFIAPPCLAYHIDALFILSFIAPQAGRRVVWEGVKRAEGVVGPRPGGRERPSSTCRKSARTELFFPLHPPHDAVPAVRTQQPCDGNIRCGDILNPRSTHFVSGSAS